jgi:hypothetical protein
MITPVFDAAGFVRVYKKDAHAGNAPCNAHRIGFCPRGIRLAHRTGNAKRSRAFGPERDAG